MYQRISADIPSEQFLRFGRWLMTGSVTHKWGIGPFHYIEAYYHAAIEQLGAGPSQKTMARRINDSIDRVTLRHERNELVATVAFEAPETGEFAFDVFRNGIRIHTQAYSPIPTLRVGIKSDPGLYRVLVFFLSPNGSRLTKYSNPIFLYHIVSTLAG
jgi:hypothetical protein